ncbi:hypothetical protein ROD_29531 [Citrobacter rodentium ICC168]|uniref:Uncharacterized protein n=1 Tax=Citrobacter rodentium (strain ICC168) TaxID=637910 RepID=D2TJQ1_CITRI|nr:hypothetical protein ROD_29531 [Citrobacter rodentium ICC168]
MLQVLIAFCTREYKCKIIPCGFIPGVALVFDPLTSMHCECCWSGIF